jgi:precorrin-3B synthase
MMSGDGLVVRVRPFGGRLTASQAKGVAALALTHGNGVIDLSSRANLQIRGVSEDRYAGLIDGLSDLGLIDHTAQAEQRRNILVHPFWEEGDETQHLVKGLQEALSQKGAPDLPGKFGFAVDTGSVPVLADASADIRIERDHAGGLILAADGFPKAMPVTLDTAIDLTIALARWFADAGGAQKRMAALLQQQDPPEGFGVQRQGQVYKPSPGPVADGFLCALSLGQMHADTLASLSDVGGLRMTPWRMVLVEGAHAIPDIDGLIVDASDPLMRVVACVGAPQCGQGLAPTKSLASQLAPFVGKGNTLHVSGCSKGCAHPRVADLAVVAGPKGWAFAKDARAADVDPTASLSPDDILQTLKAI